MQWGVSSTSRAPALQAGGRRGSTGTPYQYARVSASPPKRSTVNGSCRFNSCHAHGRVGEWFMPTVSKTVCRKAREFKSHLFPGAVPEWSKGAAC